MVSFFRFRPDPFRFRAPQISRRFFPLFQLENWFFLGCQFGFTLDVDPQTQKRLQHISPGIPTLILVNHTNFADPHVMVEMAFRHRFLCHWLAGIEPFDNAWGLFGWHIQRVGCMSVDRGLLDRWSLKTAQHTLEVAKVPLIIFPEGEADYSNRVLQPFYGGAAQLALHAQKHHPDRAVQILPIAISYQFKDNPSKRIGAGLKQLHRDLGEQTREDYPNHLPLWEQALWVLDRGLTRFEAPLGTARQERLLAAKTRLAKRIMAEHDADAPEDCLSRGRIMDFKNRWRSLIVRKRHAPDLAELQAVLGQLESASLQTETLTKLEKHWIGLIFSDLSTDKRIKQLIRHLKPQIPYAQTLAASSPEDQARWMRQMDETRQIKLLTLIEDDLSRADTSFMGIDELLTKMEILFLGKFRYRKGITATVRCAEPIALPHWLETHAELTDKSRSEALNQTFEATLSGMLTDIQGQPPWRPNT